MRLIAGETSETLAPIFARSTLGVKTNRDAWSYNSSLDSLRENTMRSISFYNSQVQAFQTVSTAGGIGEKTTRGKSDCR